MWSVEAADELSLTGDLAHLYFVAISSYWANDFYFKTHVHDLRGPNEERQMLNYSVCGKPTALNITARYWHGARSTNDLFFCSSGRYSFQLTTLGRQYVFPPMSRRPCRSSLGLGIVSYPVLCS